MIKPEERWIRQNIYSLKRLYPCRLSMYQNTTVGVNYATGLKNDTVVTCFIERAALLPSRSTRSQGQAPSLYDVSDRTFLISLHDVAPGFPIDDNLEVVHEHKRYKVSSVTFYGREVAALACKWLQGRPANETVLLCGTDSIEITESNS